jgi:L-aminopeptidase/D-esterase-like protein
MLESFKIGHSTDNEIGTGCTVIISESGAVGGVSVRGGAPGTRETDLLKSENSVEMLNAVVLAGGSAFGLEASCGVMEYLRFKEVGYNTGEYNVPIVASAVLYDLTYKKWGYPTKTMGYNAAKDAKKDNFIYGNIGAGTGATVGKIMGMEHCSKGGLGIAVTKFQNIEICAVVAVNAFGDVYDYKTNQIIAGVKMGNDFLNTESILTGGKEKKTVNCNTTLGCILTNAKLTKSQANKLADTVHNAYSLCIRPVHTEIDGDTIFVMASGEIECNTITLSSLCNEAMCDAIKKAVLNDCK